MIFTLTLTILCMLVIPQCVLRDHEHPPTLTIDSLCRLKNTISIAAYFIVILAFTWLHFLAGDGWIELEMTRMMPHLNQFIAVDPDDRDSVSLKEKLSEHHPGVEVIN